MARDINLLPELTEEEVNAGVYRRRINISVIVILLLVILIIAGFFGYWLFLASSAAIIRSQTKDAESKVLAQSRKEITRRALVAKLDEAQKFLSSAVPFSTSFDKLVSILKDSGVTLTESKFGNDGRMILTGEAPSSNNFGSLVDRLTASELSGTFGQVTLNSLSWEKKKPFYTFTIDMKYLKKGFPEASLGGSKKP